MYPHQIKNLRESLKLTQQEFANRLGLRTRSAICHWEAGRKKPTPTALILLQQWLKEMEKNQGKSGIPVDSGKQAH